MGAFDILPELVVFLTVGLGHVLGRLKVGAFSLGPIMACLLVGLVVGHLTQVEPSRDLRSAFFLMFLFANGYVIGPQFARGLAGGGSKALVLSLMAAATALALTYACARLLDLDSGMAAGLFSGAMTSAASMGTAFDAIRALDLPAETRDLLAQHVSIANALTYVGGTVGMIVFVSVIAPRLLRVALREEAQRLEAQLGTRGPSPGVFSAHQKFGVRAFRVERSAFIGSSVADAERFYPGMRYFIERIGRGERIIEASSDDELLAGDVAVVYGQVDALVRLAADMGPEVRDPVLTGFPLRVMKVVVGNPALVDVPLATIATSPLFDFRSIGVRSIARAGVEIPFGPASTLDRGDVLELIGPQRAVERAIANVGHPLLPTESTDLGMLGIGIVLGALLGLPAVTLGRVELALGVSVGVLAAGLACGWLRASRPAFGGLPEAAARLMMDFGLAAFVAAAGLLAGPQFIDALGSVGVPLIAAGIGVTLAPPLAALAVGHYLLRMNPILLLAGIAGAQTCTAALVALQDKSESSIGVIGYTVPYAASNVLLTACGTVIVTLVA